MTALVASDMVCLLIFPDSSKCTEVCISLEVIVQLLLWARHPASLAMRLKISIMKEFMLFMASCERLKPMLTCFSTVVK